ncbi:YrzI family small protein [Neobacillus niacini]|nr:YrzI family small protein [Neobacillus niacini]MCM3694036.1 YrzI family small protein [Neobacillus niacini]
MTLNILFFTIMIKPRKVTLNEAIHRELVEKRMQENLDRRIYMMGRY